MKNIPWKLIVNQWKQKNATIPWICYSGLDGAGKTGAIEKLKAEMEKCGLRVAFIHLPSDEYLVKTLLNKSRTKYGDRLLFALDNQLAGQQIAGWKVGNDYDIIISQRCWLDFFVHGAVQDNEKFDYNFSAKINHIEELPKCDVICHLVAKATTAYARIKDDPEGDKFETPAYMLEQEIQTRRAYDQIMAGNEQIAPYFSNASHYMLDTTKISEEETFLRTKEFIYKALCKAVNDE